MKIYVQRIKLFKKDNVHKASICYAFMPGTKFNDKLINCLHRKERLYYDTLRHDRRKKSYLLGRYSAKEAISSLVNGANLQEILIQPGILEQPVNRYTDGSNIQVSITHSGDFGAAVAFPETIPMGIDIEMIAPDRIDVLESQITPEERSLISKFHLPHEAILTHFWSSKESLSKVLKTGLTTPLKIYEINKIEAGADKLVMYFKNFSQYKVVSFNLRQYCCSITYPKSLELKLDTESIKFSFEHVDDDKLVI